MRLLNASRKLVRLYIYSCFTQSQISPRPPSDQPLQLKHGQNEAFRQPAPTTHPVTEPRTIECCPLGEWFPSDPDERSRPSPATSSTLRFADWFLQIIQISTPALNGIFTNHVLSPYADKKKKKKRASLRILTRLSEYFAFKTSQHNLRLESWARCLP